MAVCPAPGEHDVDALLDPAGGFCFGEPDRLEYLGNITGLDFVQKHAPKLWKYVFNQGIDPLLTMFGVFPARQKILV